MSDLILPKSVLTERERKHFNETTRALQKRGFDVRFAVEDDLLYVRAEPKNEEVRRRLADACGAPTLDNHLAASPVEVNGDALGAFVIAVDAITEILDGVGF